ncbi:MAG: DM13 domain-containing protein [Roseibium sp.]|uniref:DM13 domain-containing protein n=1 Tax=Roseibium sp. TaxID=1936156 RepID=UPI00261F2B00|nr:DM13 domain-containing protein [Roseibium sp.]MCV0424093.1 DM13 domain-containing protein [Roseibium sp.]
MQNRRQVLKLTAGFAAAGLMTGLGPAWAGGDGRTGKFSGRSNHVTTGKAELTGSRVVLFNDFSLDGAPDARVGLGKNGKYDARTDLGALKNLNGKQSYRLRNGIDANAYNEVYIWCRKFNVPLGVAKLGN